MFFIFRTIRKEYNYYISHTKTELCNSAKKPNYLNLISKEDGSGSYQMFESSDELKKTRENFKKLISDKPIIDNIDNICLALQFNEQDDEKGYWKKVDKFLGKKLKIFWIIKNL